VPVIANFPVIPFDLQEDAVDQNNSALVVLFLPRHALSDLEV
jgi:hypothetical protein